MKKRTLIMVIIGLSLLLAATRSVFTDGDFSPGNPLWNGMSGLAFSHDVRPIYDLAGSSAMAPGDTLLVIGPTRNFSDDETAAVRAFLQGSGRVIVMDDAGGSNGLLEGLGSPVTINPVPLRQYENFYVNQSCPMIDIPPGSAYSSKALELVFNHPASLNINGSPLIIASSSKYGWLDVDGDQRLSPSEHLGSYPVIASSARGNGDIIIISDPDLFINGMLPRGDNGEFLSGMIRGTPWLDVSHGIEAVPLLRAYYALRFDPLLQALTAFMILASVGLVLCRRPLMGLMEKRWGR
jgi:hypothetical protein